MSLKVYKASAGSGKTFQLALEYITLALESGSPSAFSNILAVTFTNKATAEMKDRILAQLYNLAHGGEDRTFFNEVQKRLKISESEIAKRANRTLHAIVHDYDHFRVETIDSFFQSLLTNLAHELNLTRGFRVNLDSDEVISRAVDHMLLAIGTNEGASANVTEMILKYMEEQIEDDKGWNISRELKAFAGKNLFNEEYLNHEEELDKELQDHKKIQQLKRELHQAEEEQAAPLKEMAQKLLDTLQQPYGSADPQKLKAYKAMCDFLKEMINENFHKEPTGKTIPKAFEDSEALLTKKLLADADYLHLAEEVATTLYNIEELRQKVVPYLTTASLLTQKIVPLFLLNEIGRQVSHINNETGSFLLAKTPDLFNKMVKKDDSSFVFEKSGTTFKHVMIDEFQDTSGTQWNNFKNLLVENMSQGDECMLVGDIKQSIYRWRGGNWEILANIEQEMAHLGEVEIRPLVNNFRSQKEVVEFNNAFFDFVVQYFQTDNPITDNPDTAGTIKHIYEDVAQKVNKGADKGYVRVSLMDKSIEDEEILEDLFDQITNLHNDYKVPYEEMGILVRRKDEAVRIIEYFSTEHPDIPLTSDEAFQLSASPAVLLLVNTLKYLNDPQDTVALEMSRLMAKTLSENSQRLIQEDIKALEAQREELVNMPLFELCQRLIHFFNLPEVEEKGTGQSAYIFSFFDQILAFVDEKSSDLGAFIEYWDETLYKKSISVDIKSSIYVMTIHKSKGLQRHTIMIPFCNWPLDKDYPDDIIWCNTGRLPKPFNTISLVPVSTFSSTKVKASAFNPYYQKEHMEQCIDNINALYVAFTRAEQNLLVWSKAPRTQHAVSVLVHDFINNRPEQEGEIQAPDKNAQDGGGTAASWTVEVYGAPQEFAAKVHKISDNPLDSKNSKELNLSLSGEPTNTEFRQSNQARDFIHDLTEEPETEGETDGKDISTQQQSYIDRGKLLHQLFSMIETSADVKKAILALNQQGLIDDSISQEKLEKFITKRIESTTTAPWFNGSWKLFAECNILMRNAEGKVIQRRPDRVMEKGDETIVIDYKFGSFNNKYVEQVQGYMKALIQMGRTQIKGYLWFVYTGEVREVFLD